MPNPTLPELIATLCFFCALVHSLSVKQFETWSKKTKDRPVLSTLLHFAAEIEIVFGLWAALFVGFLIVDQGLQASVEWLNNKNFSEAIFVFVVMTMAATRPILQTAEKIIKVISKLLPVNQTVATYAITLTIGPLLGSVITEPAAMTVSALLLKKILDRSRDQRLVYSTVASLFVNVSIGGTLTNFAAPPILMVARTWNWDTAYVFTHIGWKSLIAVILISIGTLIYNYKTLKAFSTFEPYITQKTSPSWIKLSHVAFLIFAILTVHYPAFVLGLFLFFVGFTEATSFTQDELKIKQSLLVAFFLAGLVVLTSEQAWWLRPVLASMQDLTLFAASTGLTAITDNAALTSLAAQVADLSDASKFSIVAGAVAGGGLTLIANAPNPAGYSILKNNFEDSNLNPAKFILYALPPTLIAGLLLWIL